jgi:deoxyribodipyrimidine photo-lyase
MPAVSRTVMWFRRDLRLDDNTALAAALARGGDVIPLFVLDPGLLRGRSPGREAWLLGSLGALDASLRQAGARLIIRRGDPREEVPRLVREVGASAVVWNRDYSPYARRRDEAVRRACREVPAEVQTFADGVLVEPEALRPAGTGFYTVFTPYYRKWLARPPAATGATATRIPGRDLPPGEPPPRVTTDHALPAFGAHPARGQLERFIETGLAGYAADRDRPDIESTSRLSPAFRLGLISPRQVHAAVSAAAARRPDLAAPAAAFLRQLCWRDFYTQVLWHAPASLTGDLRGGRRRIRWREDAAALAAWREGRTGYPLVDAGMRELAATGWMHNRVRLVTASFLTKHLLIDWRAGERWFMARLLDGDPAQNVGNWQWVASTGADALPAFRIFNPVLQGKRFDPEGAYVRRWVPELRGVAARHVHAPWEAGDAPGYPAPIVEHREARARALRALAPGASPDP